MSLEDAAALAIESIYLVSEDKEGIKHVKMSQILNDAKLLNKVQEKDIEKYAAKAKEHSAKRQS